uniref:Uncharacterized protein n=1 Tax=Rhizophora mucronata TaxID=61149 RepID=A0A2P2Q6W0_RHIMU
MPFLHTVPDQIKS